MMATKAAEQNAAYLLFMRYVFLHTGGKVSRTAAVAGDQQSAIAATQYETDAVAAKHEWGEAGNRFGKLNVEIVNEIGKVWITPRIKRGLEAVGGDFRPHIVDEKDTFFTTQLSPADFERFKAKGFFELCSEEKALKQFLPKPGEAETYGWRHVEMHRALKAYTDAQRSE
jgi:hypothetical protein